MSSNSIEDRLKAYDLQPGLGTLVMIYAPVKLAVWKTTHSACLTSIHQMPERHKLRITEVFFQAQDAGKGLDLMLK